MCLSSSYNNDNQKSDILLLLCIHDNYTSKENENFMGMKSSTLQYQATKDPLPHPQQQMMLANGCLWCGGQQQHCYHLCEELRQGLVGRSICLPQKYLPFNISSKLCQVLQTKPRNQLAHWLYTNHTNLIMINLWSWRMTPPNAYHMKFRWPQAPRSAGSSNLKLSPNR